MNKPQKKDFIKPKHINDYPVGPQFEAGHLADINAGWRTVRPVVNHEACIFCLRCYIVCPDGTISLVGKQFCDVACLHFSTPLISGAAHKHGVPALHVFLSRKI